MHRNLGFLLATSASLLLASGPAALAAGRTERASVSSAEAQANGFSFAPSISGNGQRVAFASSADNLARIEPASIAGGCCNVFVRLRAGGRTLLASANSAETPANGPSFGPFISRNGRYVAFSSTATNLLARDANGAADAFVRDLKRGTTVLASRGARGQQGDGASNAVAISASGRFVAFISSGANLVPGTREGTFNVYVRDRNRRADTVETVGFDDRPADWPADPATFFANADLSPGGRFLAFDSPAGNLVRGDGNGVRDVFVRDRRRGRTTLASVAADGGPANGLSLESGLSDDGRFVAFCSEATNLVPGDTNGVTDAFVRDLKRGVTRRVGLSADGSQLGAFSCALDLTPDGRYVLLVSAATNLVAGVAPAPGAVYRFDLKTGRTVLVSASGTGEPSNGPADIVNGGLSANGRVATFASFATNLVPGDTNGTIDVFTRVVPVRGSGASGAPRPPAPPAAVSRDGAKDLPSASAASGRRFLR